MADGSKIEWTDATWNPITGCAVVTPGCTNCYAMRLAGGRLKNTPSRRGLTRQTKKGAVWTGEVRLNEEWYHLPLSWRRPRMIFVCAHGDLFYDNVPDEWIDQVFAIMAVARQHTFQVLTKRAERMAAYVSRPETRAYVLDRAGVSEWPLPNVWLGVSAERQEEADARLPLLLETPAAVRFLSAEPLLGPIDLRCRVCGTASDAHAVTCSAAGRAPLAGLDWVIVGGESGPHARPMHYAWARSLRDQCVGAGVPFFFKQWGTWATIAGGLGATIIAEPHTCRFLSPLGGKLGAAADKETDPPSTCVAPVGKKSAGRMLDGREWNEMPR